MPRIKCRPRVAQLSPEPAPPAEVAQVTTIIPLPAKPTDFTPFITHSSGDVADQAASGLLALHQSSHSVASEKSFEPEGSFPSNVQLLTNTDLTCPQCGSRFPNMGIQDFREHVESCTRPTTAFSETSNDSLSPPPQSLLEDDELDFLPPYHLTSLTSYPESKLDGNSGETVDVVDGQQKFNYPQITDVSKFAESFEGMEDMDYATLYGRTANAQRALVQWQDEWMSLDKLIRVTEPAAAAKEQKNPRVPKGAMIGIGYQDQLESFVYGYEHNSHHKAVGMQDPVSQRLTNGSGGGRELRQRIPTQKAAEAEVSTTPESDDEGGLNRRRMRGRIPRIRNESRLNSESRDSTPPKSFASGALGRPRKKVSASSRLQELNPDLGSQKSSGQDEVSAAEGRTLATTEAWATSVNPVGTDSRPMTSSSATTGISSDGPNNSLLRTSTRTRKRQGTSDFEDALPSNKRIGKSVRKAEPGIPFSNGEPSPGTTLSSSIPAAHKQDALANGEGVGRAMKGKAKNSLKKSNAGGKPSAAKITSKKGGAAESPEEVLDGPKPSRASMNMRRRWAAKKKAEALGLPVPKIGRYPKGESVISTQEGAEQANSPKPTVGRKRKREDAVVGLADVPTTASETLAPVKRRGGRQKKAPETQPSPSRQPEAFAEGDRDGDELASTPSISPESDQPVLGGSNAVADGHVQAPQPRTSGRIRRQTSAALSSQADTHRSNRSSQKPTVTPTPVPTQQLVDEPKIKEEQPAAGPILTRNRGRQPNSANLETASQTPSIPRDIDDELGPPTKRRKAERQPKGASTDIVPPQNIHSDEAGSTHEQPAVKKRSGRSQKVAVEDTPGTETASDGSITPNESSVGDQRGGQTRGPKTGIATAPLIFPGVFVDGNVAVRAGIIRFKKIVRPNEIAPIASLVDSTRRDTKSIKSLKKKADLSTPLAKGKPLRATTTGHPASGEVQGIGGEAADAQSPKSESSEEEVLDEEAAKKAALEAAKLSKSAKMSAAMKERWKNGSMQAVMDRKKFANQARKAQMAQAGDSSGSRPLVTPASAPLKRKAAAPVEEPIRAKKSRRHMVATMDGAADTESESDSSVALPTRRATTSGRKASEHDRFQEVASPSTTPSKRPRRPAALRASQSISMFRDDNGDEENDLTEDSSSEEDEDEEKEIKKQFDSEFDHFQAALSSPLDAPVILTGKRKRKPVMNLEEAMRIEASEDEDFEDI